MRNRARKEPVYTAMVAEEICDLVADGVSIKKIGAMEGMPSRVSIARWMNKYPDFREKFLIAYEIQMLLVFDEMLDLVDEAEVDEMPKVKEQISYRKWLLKVSQPKKFGDKPEQEEVKPVEESKQNWDLLSLEERQQMLTLTYKAMGG
ncbi:hypothetical protein [Hymenobacter canadensis]|uniref:Terminase small subunit n=1 Tax=Hymenobacter canadensis TaxID=2999067 RepID=A0ABY7LRW4_9BACT|nr:hypothetical protein [Hymenobacter canadensis]WBA43157.1 hypothetical protein O3303_06230 [Hymenobacter canadensis]